MEDMSAMGITGFAILIFLRSGFVFMVSVGRTIASSKGNKCICFHISYLKFKSNYSTSNPSRKTPLTLAPGAVSL